MSLTLSSPTSLLARRSFPSFSFFLIRFRDNDSTRTVSWPYCVLSVVCDPIVRTVLALKSISSLNETRETYACFVRQEPCRAIESYFHVFLTRLALLYFSQVGSYDFRLSWRQVTIWKNRQEPSIFFLCRFRLRGVWCVACEFEKKHFVFVAVYFFQIFNDILLADRNEPSFSFGANERIISKPRSWIKNASIAVGLDNRSNSKIPNTDFRAYRRLTKWIVIIAVTISYDWCTRMDFHIYVTGQRDEERPDYRWYAG